MKTIGILLSSLIIVVSGCSAIQGITTSGSVPPATFTPVTLTSNYTIGTVVLGSASIDRILSVDEVPLRNCAGTSELTIRRTFEQQVERVPELMNFDSAFFNLSIELVMADINMEVGIDPGANAPLTETYELEMSAAPGTSVQYNAQWLLTSATGVVEIIGDNEVVFVQFSIPERLTVSLQEPIQTPCEAETLNS